MFPASEINDIPHILVVDDEPEIAESLADFLTRKEGYRVIRAGDGREAMALLEDVAASSARTIDLVLLDMRMPVISGPEVLAWIRNHPALQFLRVIVLTAASGNQEKVEALSAGADDYITKPYYPEELLARVKTILRSQQLEKQLQHQSRQLAALNQIGRSVTATLELKQILSTAAQGMAEIFEPEQVAVYMADSGRTVLQCQHLYPEVSGPNPSPRELNVGLLGQVFDQQKSFIVNAPDADDHFQAAVDAPPGLAVETMLATPLIVRGRPVGVIGVYNKGQGDFTEVDKDLASSLASSTSRAIEIAWLFQNVRARQQDLLESRNTLQAVIDGILHPIYTINDDWQLMAVNKSKVDELQTGPETLVGDTCYRAFFDRATPCEGCQVAVTLSQHLSQRWSVQFVGQDHLPEEWDVNAFPIPGTKADTARAVIVWQDRTEERRLENSLMQAGKLAAIGQLAAGVAHEINNPLTAINANAQMLQMVLPEDDENMEAVDLIFQAGERAAKVVRGLLDFARQAQYEFEPADVNESIEQALSLVTYQLTSADVEVVRSMDEALMAVQASWEHLKSVWLNLIINARDALLARSEGRQIEIITRPDPAGGHIQVLFRDNGRGMSPAEQAHIFEPFYTTKDPGQGTGLGLANCHRIIEQHGGEISVVSELGAGTTFVVRLPGQVE